MAELETNKNHINDFRKGLNTDNAPLSQPEGSYRYARNIVNQSVEGDDLFLQNEPSHEVLSQTPFKYLRGHVYIGDNETLLFGVDEDGTSHICKFDGQSVTTVVESGCLSFSLDYKIQGVYRVKNSCEKIVYFTDGINPVRSINLNRLFDYYTDAYADHINQGNDPNTFVGEKWNCIKFDLFPIYERPDFNSLKVTENGSLLSGTYSFAIQYLDENYNPTNFVWFSKTVPIFRDGLNEDYAKIEGSTIETNKGVELTFNSFDVNYPYYRVAVIKNNDGSGAVQQIVLSPEYRTNRNTFIYTGGEQGYSEITLAELTIDKLDVDTAKHISQLDGRLLLANVASKYRNVCSLQHAASAIRTNYIVDEVEIDRLKSGNSKSPSTYVEKVGYMGGEVYAFGIVYVYSDGSESPVMHIPGRRANPTDKDVIPTWEEDVHFVEPEPSIYNTLPDDNKVEKWVVKDTSVQTTDRQGELSYHENPNHFYEPKDCFPNYWGSDADGFSLEGTPIRHHKFPDRNNVPHYYETGFTKTRYELSIQLIRNPNTIWPQDAAPDVPIVITYTKDGVEQTKELIINEAPFSNVTLFVDSSFSPITNVSYVSILGSVMTINIIHTNIDASNENPTLRPLGIEFSNVNYPDPDIVGHYFVRAERTDENKTVLDKGIARTLDSNDEFYGFSYFAPVDGAGVPSIDATPHNYIFTPEFLYNRKNLQATYLKHERSFGWNADGGVSYRQQNVKDTWPTGDFFNKNGNTVIEMRQHFYNASSNNTGQNNYTIRDNIILNALERKDDWDGKTLYNVSQDNRVRVTTTHNNLPNVSADIPYVSLRDNKEVYINLDSLSYVKISELQYGNVNTKCFGGDTFIAPMHMVNTLMRQFSDGYISNVLAAAALVFIVIASLATIIATGGTATPAIIAAVSIATVGMKANAIDLFLKLVRDNPLFEGLLQDSWLEQSSGIFRTAADTMIFTGECMSGIFVETTVNTGLRIVDTGFEYYENGRQSDNAYDYIKDKIVYYDEGENGYRYRGVITAEYYKLNPDYQVLDSPKRFFPIPFEYNCCSDCIEKDPNRIHFSQLSFDEELADNYRVFLANNYTDIPGYTGEITNIVSLGNNLIIFTKEGMWVQPRQYQEKVTDEIVSYIGTGSFLSVPAQRLIDDSVSALGCIDKWSIIKVKQTLFFYDRMQGEVYMYDGKLTNISNIGVRNFFRNNLPRSSYNESIYQQCIISGYDPEFERIIFTKIEYDLSNVISVTQSSLDEMISDNVIADDNTIYYTTDTRRYYIYNDGQYTRIELNSLSIYPTIATKRFSISYSLLNKKWVSMHSYHYDFMFSNSQKLYGWFDNTLISFNQRDHYNKYQFDNDDINSSYVEYVSLSNSATTRIFNDISFHTTAEKNGDSIDQTFNNFYVYNNKQLSPPKVIENRTEDSSEFYLLSVINRNGVDTITTKRRQDYFVNGFEDLRDYSKPQFITSDNTISGAYLDKIANGYDPLKNWSEIMPFNSKYLCVRLEFRNDYLVPDDKHKVKLTLYYTYNNETIVED